MNGPKGIGSGIGKPDTGLKRPIMDVGKNSSVAKDMASGGDTLRPEDSHKNFIEILMILILVIGKKFKGGGIVKLIKIEVDKSADEHIKKSKVNKVKTDVVDKEHVSRESIEGDMLSAEVSAEKKIDSSM